MPLPLAPLMLFGAAAVAVPIALHFFYKARYKPLPWAAMRFLKQSVEQTSRRLRFQEWVLLALRCLVLCLLALALSRPAQQSATAAGRGESVDAVLVFDTSYSMGARDGDKTRLERAKAAALGVLDGLPPYSTVQVFACSDRATLLGPVSRGNVDQARQLVKTIEPSGLSGDFFPGFAEALPVLDAGISPTREVYLFSDLQKSGFERQLGALRAKCEELRAGTPQGGGRARETSLIFVRCADPARRLKNVAVVNVSMPTVIPHTDTRVPFDVLVRNTGKEPVKNVSVSLGFRDTPAEREVKVVELIDPEQTVPVTLTAKLDKHKAGPRVLTVTATNDELPGDNDFQRVILVRDKVNVLIVDGTPDTRNPGDAGSHYVVNALSPVSDAVRKDYFIQPSVHPAEGVTPAMLSNADVVYLLNVPSSAKDKPGVAGLSPEFAEALAGFVRNGGGLVIGLGDLVVPERYNAAFGSGGSKLLPFDLGELSATAAEYPYTPAPESVDPSSYLGRFADPPYNAVLRNVALTRVYKTAEGVGGRVLLKAANGLPLVTSRVVGEGEVVMVTTSLDGRWGNLPAGDVMIPFTYFTLSELTGRKVPGGNKTAGEPLSWAPPEATKGFELVKPDGSRERLGQAQAPTPGQRLTISTGDTANAGVYTIVPEGEPDDKGAAFAVNPDLRESQNLDTAGEQEMKDWLGFTPFVVQAGAGTEAAVGQQRVSSEWTEWVLLILLVFLVAESGWAWFCGKAW